MDIKLNKKEYLKTINSVKNIIKDIPYIVISSLDSEGNPWISPVNSAYDEDLNFYFKSPIDTEHGKYIRKNSKSSWVLFDSRAKVGTGVGLYFRGSIYELDENNIDDIKKGNELMAKRIGKIPSLIMKFLKMSPRRIYKCVPEEIWINGLKRDGLHILDGKVKININDLKNIL